MSFKKHLQAWRLKWGKALLDKSSKPVTGELEPISKMLFLRYDGKIGDYIVSAFVFREIKKQAPHVHIAVVCSEKNAYLFKRNPYIDQLYFVKVKDIADYIRCGRELAKAHYDVVIDPTVLLRNRDLLFLRLINAKYYVGYKKEDYRLFNLNIKDTGAHFSEVYRQALEKVNFHTHLTAYDVPSDAESAKHITQFLTKNRLFDYVAVNFFGAGNARRFDEKNMKRLLDYLTSNKINILLLNFPECTPQLKKLAAQYEQVFLYEQSQTVFDSIELIRHARLVISPDTAIIHIAAGLNKPIIGFYSQDAQNFQHWHPNNQAETHILRFQKSVNELDFSQIKPEWLTQHGVSKS